MKTERLTVNIATSQAVSLTSKSLHFQDEIGENKIYHEADEKHDILAEAAPERLELRGLHNEFESTSASCSASSDARFSRPKSSSNALPANMNTRKLVTAQTTDCCVNYITDFSTTCNTCYTNDICLSVHL